MNYAWLDEYLLSLPGAEKDYKPEWGWFRYMLRGKLFAAVCSPGPEHRTYGGHDLVNLKCAPGSQSCCGPNTRTSCRAFTATSAHGSPVSWTGLCPMRSCGNCARIPTAWCWKSCPNMRRGKF